MEQRVEYEAGQPKRGELWLGFDTRTGAQEGRDAFLKKFGYPAEVVKIGINVVLVGPVKEGKGHVNYYDPPAGEGEVT